MRRATVRAALSASRASTTKTSMLGVASQIPVASVGRIAVPVSIRCISQTLRVANEAGNSLSSSSSGGTSVDLHVPILLYTAQSTVPNTK